MFSPTTIKLVSDFLLTVARTEKKIELLREKLCENEDFEPYASFRRIDRDCKNFLTEDDLKAFLQDNQIFYDEETVRTTFIQHYDYDSDGKLCYAEFLRALLPCDQPGLRTLVTQRPTYQVNEDEMLEKSIENSLARFLEAEILYYINLDPQKKEISFCGDFSVDLLFSEIDKETSGFVDFQSLNEYFKANNYYPYEEEIISILRRLDKNDDGRLTLPELELAFKPLSAKEKEFQSKQRDLKSLYSSTLNQNNEKNLSASKNFGNNLNNTARHVKQSSITQTASNKKITTSPYYQSKTIYKSPIARKNLEDSDSYSKVSGKFERYESSSGKISNVSNVIANEINKSPANYCYYPYEPVRKAFSPLKEQILKSSNASILGVESVALKQSQNFEKVSANPVDKSEKYEKYNAFRSKYSNEYSSKMRSPPAKTYLRNEETLKRQDSGLKNEVINYFKKIVHLEGDIEKCKQDLFFRPDFNLLDLYMIFDGEKKGYCFLNDFEQAFKAMSVNISGREALLFFKKFEKNNCGRLRLAEFSKIFSPILLEGQPLSERRSINNEGQFDYFELFSAETRRLIGAVLKMHLDYEITIESQREFICARDRNNLQEVFDMIDSNKDGLLDFYEMKAFLENEGNFSDKDITLLNERMNPVINGKISFEDFKNELSPHL